MQHLLRNKINFLVLLAMLCSFKGMAQFGYDLNQLDHDDKPVHFGINAGINRSHYNITHHPRFLAFDSVNVIESINNTGLNLAWLVNFRLGKHFDLRTYPLNLVFSQKAFEYRLRFPSAREQEDSLMLQQTQGISLSFPVQIKFSSDRIENFKVYAIGGVKLDYDLAANAGKKNTDDVLVLKKLDYGVEAGIGFHLYFPVFVLSPELKVGYNFRNVHQRSETTKYSNTIDRLAQRSISFTLTVE